MKSFGVLILITAVIVCTAGQAEATNESQAAVLNLLIEPGLLLFAGAWYAVPVYLAVAAVAYRATIREEEADLAGATFNAESEKEIDEHSG